MTGKSGNCIDVSYDMSLLSTVVIVWDTISFNLVRFLQIIFPEMLLKKTFDSHWKKPLYIYEFAAKKLCNASFSFAMLNLCSFTVIKYIFILNVFFGKFG